MQIPLNIIFKDCNMIANNNQMLPAFKTDGDCEVRIFESLSLGRVRVVIIENEPHFCLSDIAKVLGIQNGRDLKSAIDREFDKGGRFNLHPLQTKGGTQDFSFINESELYFVLMRSDKPQAKPFRQWVTKEVLPTIRKTGSYDIQKAHKLPTYSEALRQLADSLDKNAELENKIKADAPKVEYAEAIMSAENSLSIGDFAKFLASKGVATGEKRFFMWLRENSYLQSNNLPYQRFVDSGYFEILPQSYKCGSQSIVTQKTLLTAKGQCYFTKKFL